MQAPATVVQMPVYVRTAPVPILAGRLTTASLVLLIVAAALNGMSIQVHGLSVYPEYIALGIVLAWAAAATALGWMRPYLPPSLLPLGVWLGTALLATLLFAPDRHASLILWIKLPLMVATYLAVSNLARRRIARIVAVQLAVAAGVALVALAAYISWKLTGSHWGMQHPGRNFGHAWLPAATLREPDILGSYLAAAALVALPAALLVRHDRSLVRAVTWGGIALAVLGVALSGARSAWLAPIAALTVPLALGAVHEPRRALRRYGPAAGLIAACAAGLVVLQAMTGAIPAFNPHENGDLVQRVASFGTLSHDRDVVVRFEIAGNALSHWTAHPLTGWGVGAYGEVYTYPPPDTIHPGWISNLPVHLLYDSGLLGLAGFVWAMVVLATRGIRAWSATSGVPQALLAGILLSLLSLLLAFQATEASWFSYPWIYLGLLEASILASPAGRGDPEIALCA